MLSDFFQRKYNEREWFGNVLKDEIKSYGKTPDSSGSFIRTAHRAWMNIKALLTPKNDEAMLEEALRFEQATLEEFNDVLNAKIQLPHSTHRILKNQRDEILKDALNIKRLDDLQKHVS